MKRYFIVISSYLLISAAAFAGGFDFKIPVEGDSIANDTMQFAVMKDIYKELSQKNAYCFDYSIVNTQIVQYPYDVKIKDGVYLKGVWKELWTINACTKRIQVPVTYSINKSKASYKIESNLYTQ